MGQWALILSNLAADLHVYGKPEVIRHHEHIAEEEGSLR
jgi:hypothetical protein